jgi:hypothetical protein
MKMFFNAAPPSRLLSPIAVDEKVKSRQDDLPSPEKVFGDIRVDELL